MTTVNDVVQAVRVADENAQLNPDQLPTTAATEQAFGELDGALNSALGGKTLKQLSVREE